MRSESFSILRRSIAGVFLGALALGTALSQQHPSKVDFRRDVQPILAKYCYDCHGNGVDKGGVSLDEFNDVSALKDHTLWLRALRNVRSGLMPPAEEEQLPAAQAEKLLGVQ